MQNWRYHLISVMVFCAVFVTSLAAQSNANDFNSGKLISFTVARKLSLIDALEIGLARQVNIVHANGEITKAESQKLSSISNFIPSLSIDDQAELYKPMGQSGYTFIAGTLVPASQGLYNNAVTANFNLNLFSGGKDIATYRAAMDAIQSANAALQESINKVFVIILSSYVAFTKVEIAIQKQRKIATIDLDSARLTQARYQHDMSSRIDWIAAEQAALQAQTQLDQYLQQEASDRERLLRAMGYTQSLAVFTTSSQIPGAPNASFSSPDQMNDPAIESARARIAEARQQVNTARAGFWPTLSLVAQYNWGPFRKRNLKYVKTLRGHGITCICWLSYIPSPAGSVTGAVIHTLSFQRDRKRCTNCGACPRCCFYYFLTYGQRLSETAPFRTDSHRTRILALSVL